MERKINPVVQATGESINSAQINYGIIGAGEHAYRAHAEPGKDIPGLNLVGVFDPNQTNAKEFETNFGRSLKIFNSEDELLAGDIEAVLISSPDKYHIQSLAKAIEAGKHILVEKPLAINKDQTSELRKLLEEAQKTNLLLTSCHPRRFDPPFLWLQKNLPDFEQKYGAVLNFNFDFTYHEPSLDWKQDRSLLMDHFNHEIDLLHFLFGVSSFEAWKLSDSFDRYEVVGQRKDGLAFNFRGTRRLKSTKYTEFAFIRFNRADLRLDTETGQTALVDHETDEIINFNSGKTDYPIRFASLMRNFVKTIQGLEENYLSSEDLWLNNWSGVELTSTGRCSY